MGVSGSCRLRSGASSVAVEAGRRVSGSCRLRSGASSSVATAGEALLLSGGCAEMLFPEKQEKKLQQQHLLAIVAQDGYAAISL